LKTLGAQAARPRNILRINGVDIPGGITAGQRWKDWRQAAYLEVSRPHRGSQCLREQNGLHIESVKIPLGHDQTFDNFIIDNIVILFKVQAPSGVGPSDDAIPLSK
jgi:hypothetical protein